MTALQKLAVAVLLLVAFAAGVGIYLNSRSAEIPDGYPLTDLEGQPGSLAAFRGRPLIVNFWATWCPPCRREIPLLKKIQAENEALTVIGIAVEDPPPVQKLADEIGFNYPILIGEQTAVDLAVALGIEFIGLPYTVLIDAEGRVLEIHSGELKEGDVDATLDLLLGR
ncbi:MAG: TlpA family protein disulfide reductase [Gammaproteobacteria bacterium]|nr:TlpA family protein disulfide reductase [Gammaproteobacteria bacterium]